MASIVLALLLGAGALAVFLHNAQTGLAARLAATITGRTQSFVSVPDVVERVQRLNRLETVVYSLDTVVEGRDASAILPDALAGDRLLMIVHGQTIAGIDFSQMKASDVQLSERNGERAIRLKLPPSQIFLTAIDNGKTRVYARSTGLFVAADPNLESATRAKAQGELQRAGERRDAHLRLAALLLRERAHLGVERSIAEHRVEAVEFGGLAAVFADGRRHLIQPRQLARQGHERRRIGVGGEPAVDLVVAAQDQVELVPGQDALGLDDAG